MLYSKFSPFPVHVVEVKTGEGTTNEKSCRVYVPDIDRIMRLQDRQEIGEAIAEIQRASDVESGITPSDILLRHALMVLDQNYRTSVRTGMTREVDPLTEVKKLKAKTEKRGKRISIQDALAGLGFSRDELALYLDEVSPDETPLDEVSPDASV